MRIDGNVEHACIAKLRPGTDPTRPAAKAAGPAGSRDQYLVAQRAALTGAGNAAAPASSAAVA
jgi:hypothetical protein